jgi:serine/threonine-protein phosphatase 2A regulatory subunit A
MCQVYEK